MPARGRRATRKGALAPLPSVFAAAGLLQGSARARACRSEPAQVTPPPAGAACHPDPIAVVHLARERPVTAPALAQTRRLWRNQPLNAPIAFAAAPSRACTVRVLKGRWPAGFLPQNGATQCQVQVGVGHDCLLFAKLPPPGGDRLLQPLHRTLVLRGDEHDRPRLTEVALALQSLKSTP